MSQSVIEIEHLYKQYRIGEIGTGTLTHDINRIWYKIKGAEDPYSVIGSNNLSERDYVWALKDINFSVKEGEVLGIIGKNGAGKSTLLKLLSQITLPTKGEIRIQGRLASLLEVGTGFHPELTGKENVFLNGAILGMTKSEVKSKLNEIVEFSGVEKYIDTPVKRYSSGMKVRLGFAVAAHLEPEILVVDEVLAVGDAEFQKKCIGKMKDVSEQGRTVLFVSHNMESVQNLCSRCIVLNNGKIEFSGKVDESIDKYLNLNIKNVDTLSFPIVSNKIEIQNLEIWGANGNSVKRLIVGDKAVIFIKLLNASEGSQKFNIRVQIFDSKASLVTTLNTAHVNKSKDANSLESIEFKCVIEKLNLVPGEYFIGLKITDQYHNEQFSNERVLIFEVEGGDFYGSGKIPNRKNLGKFLTEYDWL